MKAIGLDVGTTGISGILLDADSGKVIKSITKNSNSFIKTQNEFEKIQDVDKIISISMDILGELLEDGVSAIGVTGQMHGIVYFDQNGKAVSPLYIWQDKRGDLEYKGTTYAKFLDSYSGYGCVTDFYNRENGLVPKTAKGFCTIADYLVMQLCGLKSPLIHTTNLASFGCYDNKTKTLNYDYVSNTTDEFSIAGYYKGIPVSVAIGDNQASVLSSCTENDLLVNVGTGSQVSIVSDKNIIAPNVETRPYFENKNLIVGCALCGGRAYSLLKEFYKQIISYKTDITEEEVYAIMGKMLSRIDNPTIVCDTRFAGSRADQSIKGSFNGITTENFNPSEFTSSVLIGMAKELYDMYALMKDKKISLVGSGNGVRKNPYLIKVLEQIFSAKLKTPVHQEEASFGAVIFALIAIKKYDSVISAQKSLIKYS